MVPGCGDRAPNADVAYVLCVKRLTPKSISNKIIFQFFIEVASEIIYCKPLQKKSEVMNCAQNLFVEKGSVGMVLILEKKWT